MHMLTAADLNDEAPLETDEVDDIAVAQGLAVEVESSAFFRSADDPAIHLLRGHSFAKAARDFVSPAPTRPRFARAPSPFGGGI